MDPGSGPPACPVLSPPGSYSLSRQTTLRGGPSSSCRSGRESRSGTWTTLRPHPDGAQKLAPECPMQIPASVSLTVAWGLSPHPHPEGLTCAVTETRGTWCSPCPSCLCTLWDHPSGRCAQKVGPGGRTLSPRRVVIEEVCWRSEGRRAPQLPCSPCRAVGSFLQSSPRGQYFHLNLI